MALERPFHITRVVFGSGKVLENVNLADVHELLEYSCAAACIKNCRSHVDGKFNRIQVGAQTFVVIDPFQYPPGPRRVAEWIFWRGTSKWTGGMLTIRWRKSAEH